MQSQEPHKAALPRSQILLIREIWPLEGGVLNCPTSEKTEEQMPWRGEWEKTMQGDARDNLWSQFLKVKDRTQ